MKIRKLCVISDGYPTCDDPYMTFVEEICKEYSRLNIEVIVIAPQSVVSAIRHKKIMHPELRYDDSVPTKVTIYQPKYLLSLPHKYRTINNLLFRKAVEKCIKKNNISPDAFYGHFWFNAFAASRISKKEKCSLFAVAGEGDLESRREEFKKVMYNTLKKTVTGVICVSTNNRNISVDMGLVKPEDTIVLPNAIDNRHFHIKDKCEIRKMYGYPEDAFIIIFVGAYVNRKGPQRVANAINLLNDKEIKSFFIGGAAGGLYIEPECAGILYKGKLRHDLIPDYLNMADIFVLPTLNEGCCNAVVEALACGLPVISSNLPFNWDVLNETNSIMVDPENIEQIADAIKRLKDDVDLRNKLSEGALKTAESLTIAERARKIINFMESKIK